MAIQEIGKRLRLPTWREMNLDTDPATEAMLFTMWRETPAGRKLEIMGALNLAMREMALAGLRSRNPQATPEQLRRTLADILLGSEQAAKVYGPLAADS